MHAIIGRLEDNTTEKTPSSASIIVIHNGKVVLEAGDSRGQTHTVVNLSEARWVLVDNND